MRIPTRHEMQLAYYGGPLAIIKQRKNNLVLREIYPMREYFICDMGVFAVDSDTRYRHGKQAISFYNSHGTMIPEKTANKIKYLYRKKHHKEAMIELEKIYPEIIKGKHYDNIHDAFEEIVEKTQHHAIDIGTEKYLRDFIAYKPISIKRLNQTCNEGKKAVDDLSPKPLKAALPMGLMIIVAVIFIAMMQNIPKWIREFQSGLDFGKFLLGAIIDLPSFF